MKVDFTKELNKEQYKIVTAQSGPRLVLAGAGSGKTRTLIYRIAYLIEQGINSQKILLVTFTNKAAQEMKERTRKILNLGIKDKLPIWSGTFHSLANRLLRIYGEEIGIKNNFSILDTQDSKALIKKIAKEYFSSLDKKRRPSANIIKETISFATNSGFSIAESLERKFGEWLPFLEIFEKINKEYIEKKKIANSLDFDDLLLAWKKLTIHPKIGPLLQKKWGHILVDEYQDTNYLQDQIIYNLAQDHQNIIVVGDDAQSIYSFRAANIDNILNFPKVYNNCKLHKLEMNYRSTPEILSLANHIIKENKEQFPKNLKAVLSSFLKPKLLAAQNNREEALMIADNIEELLTAGLELKEIAVLFRAANHSQFLEMELNKRGLAYEMRGGLKFFERAHIKDIIAYSRVLANIHDEASWSRVLQVYEGIGELTTVKIFQEIINCQKIEDIFALNLNLSSKAQKSYLEIINLFKKLNKFNKKELNKILDFLIKEYSPYLNAHYPDYQQRSLDLEQLIIFSINYKDLNQFLAEVSLQENFNLKDRLNKDHNKIILSTIHQAKGLEWPAVFIINLNNQAFPNYKAIEQGGLEEERRLFYVAITRAQKNLYLSYSLANIRFSGYQNLQPSEFIANIDNNLLDYNSLAKGTYFSAGDDIQYIIDQDSQDKDDFLPDISDW